MDMPDIIISDELVKLLICIATMKRGHTHEQNQFLNRMEKRYFPEEED